MARSALRGLSEVPPLTAVEEIAATLRASWGQSSESRLDLDAVLRELEIELLVSDLGASEGGPVGLLTPLGNGGFRIEVDCALPQLSVKPSDTLHEEILRHRTRFIVAHEIAHTLFYWDGRRGPERLVRDSAEQERFCDALAAALLVPANAAKRLALRPESVVAIHEGFDVSVEVAARTLVEAHGDAVAWLVILPEDQAEPWVQWGAEKTRETVGPWGLLTRLTERVRDRSVLRGRLRWRSGRTTVAQGLYLDERKQLVVTARAG